MAFSEGSPSTPRSPGRCRVPSAGDGGLSLRARASSRSSEGTWGGGLCRPKSKIFSAPSPAQSTHGTFV